MVGSGWVTVCIDAARGTNLDAFRYLERMILRKNYARQLRNPRRCNEIPWTSMEFANCMDTNLKSLMLLHVDLQYHSVVWAWYRDSLQVTAQAGKPEKHEPETTETTNAKDANLFDFPGFPPPMVEFRISQPEVVRIQDFRRNEKLPYHPTIIRVRVLRIRVVLRVNVLRTSCILAYIMSCNIEFIMYHFTHRSQMLLIWCQCLPKLVHGVHGDAMYLQATIHRETIIMKLEHKYSRM